MRKFNIREELYEAIRKHPSISNGELRWKFSFVDYSAITDALEVGVN